MENDFDIKGKSDAKNKNLKSFQEKEKREKKKFGLKKNPIKISFAFISSLYQATMKKKGKKSG